jgi:pimeloyl-ACP methyl ester carboxylesterase
MVLRGQYLERPTLVDAEGVTLEAFYHHGTRPPPLLVCAPHGIASGMDAPPVAELAWACARTGHASLRFQYRGTGASAGDPDPSRTVDDALAAYLHLIETTATRSAALAGVGAGCATALELARRRPEVERLVLVAPEALPDLSGTAARAPPLLPEVAPVVDPAALAALLGPNGRLRRIIGADARFLSGLPMLGRLAAEWIS